MSNTGMHLKITHSSRDSQTGTISGLDSRDVDWRMGNFFKAARTEILEGSLTFAIKSALFETVFLAQEKTELAMMVLKAAVALS